MCTLAKEHLLIPGIFHTFAPDEPRNPMKHILILVTALLLGILPLQAQNPASHGLGPDATLAELVAPGNHVLIVFEDKTGDFDEKDAYIREYLEEDSPWVVVADKRSADFVLSIEGWSDWTEASFTSKTYFMTPSIRRPDGTELWKGDTVRDWGNLSNGFRAVRGVSRKLVDLSLKRDLMEAVRDNRVILIAKN